MRRILVYIGTYMDGICIYMWRREVVRKVDLQVSKRIGITPVSGMSTTGLRIGVHSGSVTAG